MTGRDTGGRARERCIAFGVSTFAIGALLLTPASGIAAPASVIRTGGPSAPGDAKVAIVAGPASLEGSRFAVYRGRKIVLRGRLRPAPGRSAPWSDAFRADLSSLRRPGAYRVHAAGHTSRRWLVHERGSEDLIPLILRFFEANRDGSSPALLHGPAHLHDARVAGSGGLHVDLTGGWMDAGDMLHFTQTTAYATMVLEAAARLDPIHRSRLEEEAEVGIAWLLKAHPAAGLFITQIGDKRDHERDFTDPARDDSSGLPGIANRIAYHWGGAIGGDIGGKVAAALAMAAIRSPEPTRSSLIEQAREWYEAGRASGRGTPALHGAGGFYVVDDWRDSLAAGAAALYRATAEDRYLTAAQAYLARSDSRRILGYFNAAPLAAADICGHLGAPALGPPPARRQACRFLRRNGRRAGRSARRDAFGLAGPATWGTTSSNGAGGAIAAISGHRAIASGARDYLLGRNPWGASFVTGFGPRSPRAVSSWASVFGPGRPVGAVVGGPAPRRALRAQGFRPGGRLRRFNSGIVYEDRRRDYVTSEPALDYAANTILLLAALQRR
jgi:endoglucanase